jgi:hypothetical protein
VHRVLSFVSLQLTPSPMLLFRRIVSGIGFAPCSASIILREQAIIVSIDQYAEAALGNREYFLNKPYGIGGRSDNIP